MQPINSIENHVGMAKVRSLNTWQIYFLVLGLESLIFLFDTLTDSSIPLYSCYIFPIAFSTWLLDRKFSYLLVIFSSFAAAYVLSGEFQGKTATFFLFNFLQIATTFSLFEYLVHIFRKRYKSVEARANSLDIVVQHSQKRRNLAIENVVWQSHVITRVQHEQMNKHRGAVVWLTGLPGSGKTTIANAVEEKLHYLGFQTVVLDGDNIRHNLCADLGFSDADRNENVRRVGEVAKLFIEQGTVVLVALVSPIRSAREKVRQSLPDGDFMEIYCSCPLPVCAERDPKGMYAQAMSGKISKFTGISSSYEEPLDPVLRIDTGNESAQKSVDRVVQLLTSKLR